MTCATTVQVLCQLQVAANKGGELRCKLHVPTSGPETLYAMQHAALLIAVACSALFLQPNRPDLCLKACTGTLTSGDGGAVAGSTKCIRQALPSLLACLLGCLALPMGPLLLGHRGHACPAAAGAPPPPQSTSCPPIAATPAARPARQLNPSVAQPVHVRAKDNCIFWRMNQAREPCLTVALCLVAAGFNQHNSTHCRKANTTPPVYRLRPTPCQVRCAAAGPRPHACCACWSNLAGLPLGRSNEA